MAGCQPHSDRTAEVVHHERDAGEVERQDQSFEIVDVVLQPVTAALGRFALAESHMVGNDYAPGPAQRLDEIAEQVAPGWLAVQAEQDFAVGGAFIDVVHAEAGAVGEMGV